MDINESNLKEDLSKWITSLQNLLPKKKDIIIIQPQKAVLTRLGNIHFEAKSVFPKCFTGTKLVILRELFDKVKLVQQYNFGRPKDSYKCFSHFIHKEMETQNNSDGLVIDSTGSATASYKEVLEDGIEIKLTSKIKDLISSETEMVLEKETDKLIGSFSCTMKDVDPKTLRVVTQFIYKVLPEFSVGIESGMRPLYPLLPDISISSRYEKGSLTLSSTVSQLGFQVCLYKQLAPDLRIATIVNENKNGPNMGFALHKMYGNGSEFKVFIDSQRCGGFTFEKDVHFVEHNDTRVVRLVASTLIDRQRRVRFGFGFHLDF
ncbi:uncharacterized protein LOC126965258 [Leptidea sinapis]|uniref:Uncharacterized protein n=1 Tax=Leptidea sinapis TaxID=189913 RepID=A0A5E4QF96_9NEOP|nr:uncharacterized protein LOC126965258 [Leptidea sinapis]VVC95649.1 unnamed protein product [Leptidea sinapis]